MNPLESELQTALLLAAPAAIPHLRLFRRNVAKVRVGKRTIRFAIPGQCDLYGLVRGGRHIEVELKAAAGSLSAEQRAWRDFCQEWNVPWLLLQAGRGETVEVTVSRWLSELARSAI